MSETAVVPKFVFNYMICDLLGTGSCARVHLAFHLRTNRPVAIKFIDRHAVSTRFTADYLCRREIQIMQQLRHPNIIELIEVMEDNDYVYIVQEFAAKGDLQTHLNRHGPLSESHMRRCVQQALSALQYCHAHGIAHRDLKAENFLFDADLNLKLADFGLSSMFLEGQALKTHCGTPAFAAPELFKGFEYSGPEVDSWALGIVINLMATAKLPFPSETIGMIRRAVIHDSPLKINIESSGANEVILGFLEKDPALRMTVQQAMVHSWVTDNGKDILLPFVGLNFEGSDLHMKIIKKMAKLDYTVEEISTCLHTKKFSDAYATYQLLAQQFIARGDRPTALPESLLEVTEQRILGHMRLYEGAQESVRRQSTLVMTVPALSHPSRYRAASLCSPLPPVQLRSILKPKSVSMPLLTKVRGSADSIVETPGVPAHKSLRGRLFKVFHKSASSKMTSIEQKIKDIAADDFARAQQVVIRAPTPTLETEL